MTRSLLVNLLPYHRVTLHISTPLPLVLQLALLLLGMGILWLITSGGHLTPTSPPPSPAQQIN